MLLLDGVIWVEELVRVQFLADADRSRNVEETLVHVVALVRRQLANSVASALGPRFPIHGLMMIVVGHVKVLHGDLAVVLDTLVVGRQVFLAHLQLFVSFVCHEAQK